jgi:hypothetical protein
MVAEEGGESSGSQRRGLSRILSSVEVGEGVDKGVIGRGLSEEGVRETEKPRKAPSMVILEGGESSGSRRRELSKALSSIEVGEEVDKGVSSIMISEARRESMRVSMEKEDKELIRSIAGCMSCTGTSFEAGRREACGRSGERGGTDSSWGGRWHAVCMRPSQQLLGLV